MRRTIFFLILSCFFFSSCIRKRVADESLDSVLKQIMADLHKDGDKLYRFYDYSFSVDLVELITNNHGKTSSNCTRYVICNQYTFTDHVNNENQTFEENTLYKITSICDTSLYHVVNNVYKCPGDTTKVHLNREQMDIIYQLGCASFEIMNKKNLSKDSIALPFFYDGPYATIMMDFGYRGGTLVLHTLPDENSNIKNVIEYLQRLAK